MAGPLNKDAKKQIKNELETLLSQFGSNDANSEADIIDSQFSQIVQAPPIDFDAMHTELLKKSVSISNSIFDFYIGLGIINSHTYLKAKKDMDDSNMSTLFFQIKTLKFTIEKLMQSINDGSAGPKTFEVLGQLHDKLANAVKTQTNYVLFIEDSYKKMKTDIRNRDENLGLPDSTETSSNKKTEQYYISAGTKSLMKDLAGEPKDLEFKLSEFDSNLTDPRKKDDLMESNGLGHLKVVDKEDDDYSDSIDEMI